MTLTRIRSRATESVWRETASAADRMRRRAAHLDAAAGSRYFLSMKVIKRYPTSLDADLARIALEAADIPAFVVGIGVGMEGGAAGVQLLVPEDRVEAALKVLEGA